MVENGAPQGEEGLVEMAVEVGGGMHGGDGGGARRLGR